MLEKIKNHVENCMECYLNGPEVRSLLRNDEMDAIERKHESLEKRNAKIVKNIVDGKIINEEQYENRALVDYVVTIQHVIKHKEQFYIEENMQTRRIVMEDEDIIDDYLLNRDGLGNLKAKNITQEFQRDTRQGPDYIYDRMEAVRYAERWWNDFNPAYQKFENDCTNYISQCLHAGGAPMTGQPNRSNGWWYQNDQWSYSWTVAHALRWYFSGTKSGLLAREVSSADQLMKGDIICYDFNGDDNWQHTTIVTGRDGEGEPLVNAHTTNSRMRYWKYDDSTAWTPNIKYKFFHIIDKNS
ncbi:MULTISPECIES: amidase domain-containing protein [Bacillaceae]|uniref:Amidase domain-containing protein n=1 Tax=Evansella alkalicola TaxID=745819 RepID=A0ABS6JS14_9BACI|nr:MULTISPECIES: amidase domain-containing protein [Bacillaceae]MBU9720856.1 amidase domain-containing protein [Bacillus alkalicola]